MSQLSTEEPHNKKRRVKIISREDRYQELFFHVERVKLQHELQNGELSEPMMRLNFKRGDGVAALVHNKATDHIILIEQFRYPTYEKDDGWMLELPAGIVEATEAPEETMKRELVEEIGYHVETLEPISTFYLSPGGSSERMFLFYGAVTDADKKSAGGGLPTEQEDIRLVSMPTSEAVAKVNNGTINDAKTIVALQWLQLRQQAND